MSDSTRPARPSLLGEAPRLVPFLLPPLGAAVAARILAPEATRWTGILRGAAFAAGLELAAVGLLFWASAAFGLVRAFRAGRLATRGAYGLCRHPIFSWWIFFVLPAAALILDAWPFLACAAAFYALARGGARREEEELRARFGKAYEDYAARVRPLLPLPILRPLSARRLARGLAGLAGLGAFALAVLVFLVAPLASGYGTRAGERRAALPGDELVARVRQGHTQAVEIAAPPEAVWPWLVQVGYRRAGWYNVDAINLLASPDYFLEGRSSARRIVPELQDLAIGDLVELAPGVGLSVVRLEPPRLLVLAGNPEDPEAESNAAWTFALSPDGKGGTRLVTRFRSAFPGGLGAELLNGFVNVVGGAVVRQPAMLAGLESRAERAAKR